MKKYLVVALAALGLAVFAPQPADAGVSFGFFFGPPIYYYPAYYPAYYYYGYPHYYGPRYYGYHRYWRHGHCRWLGGPE
jgi:hypothetical protein